MQKSKRELFIEKSKEKFPQFDYSNVEEFTNIEKDKVTIICSEHGAFKTTPKCFLKGKYGCPKCANRLKGLKHKSGINSVTINVVDLPIIENPLIVNRHCIIGTVYCFKNKTNGKLYIGKTVKRNYEERFTEHRVNSVKNPSNYFYKALNKYGWEGFDKVVLFQTETLEDTNENKKLLNDIVNAKEAYYIDKYDTTNHSKGYNLTKGGDGIVGYKFSEEVKAKMSASISGKNHWNYGKTNSAGQPILQFDLDFNFIKEWPSAAEAARDLNCKSSNISRCCSNNIDTYKGYIWVKKSDYYEGYLQKYKSRAKCKSNDKTVFQYDFLGNFIAEYSSCTEAGTALGRKTVSSAAAGRDPQAYGYIWIYKEDYTPELLQDKLEKVKTCRFYNKIIKNL